MKQRHPRMSYQLLDLKISTNTKHVYMALLHFRSHVSKKIKVSLAKVSDVTGLKGRQLTKHINTLIQYKIISRKQNKHSSEEYGCNVYTILCDERYFAEIPWEIAYNDDLSVNAKIGYCIMKRFTDLDRNDFICYMTKSELAEKVGCSANEVDKIKRNLKQVGLIAYERNSNKITLVYEKSLDDNKNEIKQVVRSKNRVSQHANHSVAF